MTWYILPLMQTCFEGKGQRGKGEPVMDANQRQVGGTHYRDTEVKGLQHWDLVNMFGWDYFQGQITKYLMRWRKKNGLEDLEKARHYLDKYIELERAKRENEQNASRGGVPAGNESTQHDQRNAR
jgi:Protein of unknwon function (DUF3310)